MARIKVAFDGSTAVNGSPLLMHNERLADPLDPYTRWLAELSKKTKKTERDIEEIGRREFLGAGYWLDDNGPGKASSGPYIPTWNIIRCLQEAAKRHKLGKNIVRGIVPVTEETPLVYDGPQDTDALWKSGTFHSRKGVGVGTKRVMRTRPCFPNWKVECELELDLSILDPDVVDAIAVQAGQYEGLGDARPRFGRFFGSVELVGDPAGFLVPDLLDEAREKLVAATARKTITQKDEANASVSPNGKERAGRVSKRLASKS